MIIDDTTLLIGIASAGWVSATALTIALIRRGHKLRTKSAELVQLKEDAISQSAKLEQLDGLRDDLAFERQRVGELERQEAALSTRLEVREQYLNDMRSRLENEFRTMSSRLVRETGDALLREASQNFEKQHIVARQDAENYSRSVSDLLKPMKDTLNRYEEGLRDMRDHQKKAQGELSGQITSLAQSATAVQAEAQSLASALKAGPRTRGRWGETTLRNVVEMVGLSDYCDFSEQHSVTDENASRKQPDMVVRLPGERMVVIDSKVSLNDWLDAASADSEARRTDALSRHGKSVWTHVQSLAAKDYAAALKKAGAIDFVVMFMPGETFFTAAIEARPSLFQDAYEKGVLIATPTTLVAILKSVAHSWRQQKMTENVHIVANLASDLYDSLRKTGDYLADLGKSLDKTVSQYNSLVGNMETRVMPRARRFADYEMPGTEKPIAAIPPSDADVRTPSAQKDLIISSSYAAE